ncbi:MAG: cytochrome c oxidase, cbb3-type, CcoQ subunit [Sulfurovaceae bacterium]|nr:cytochrome c oxidase, cbb3-type, CcoQ subunit [Sulfurovaceae bacterium]
MDIKGLQVYATFFMTIFLVVMLYGYIVYLYRSEKKGVKDYEKYGKIALDDEIDSTPIEKNPKLDNEDKGAK